MNNQSSTQLGIETIRGFFEDKIEKSLLIEYKEIIKTLKNDGFKEDIEYISKTFDATQHINMRLNQLLKIQQYCQSLALKDDSLFEQLQNIIDSIQATSDDVIEQKKLIDKSIKDFQKTVKKSSEAIEIRQALDHLLQKKYKSDELKKNTHIINLLKQNNTSIASLILSRKQDITEKFEPNGWLESVAKNAKNVSLQKTHISKLTHSSAKPINLNTFQHQTKPKDGYLSTKAITSPAYDVAYTSAGFASIADFLRTPYENQSLGELIIKNHEVLMPFATDEAQAKDWQSSIKLAFHDKDLVIDELVKQVYFPVADEYHLLCPLMSSSLAQEIDERIWQTRQADMPARIARKNKQYSDKKDVIYPVTAKIQVTQSKHFNVSNLSNKRSGRLTLLSSAPPIITSNTNRLLNVYTFKDNSIFNQNLAYIAQDPLKELRNLLLVLKNKQLGQSLPMKKRIVEIVNNIVDVVIIEVANVQNQLKQDTEFDISKLPKHEQYWLACYRQDDNTDVAQETVNWQEDIAFEFAKWINEFVNTKDKKLSLSTQYREQWQKILNPSLRSFIAQTEVSLKVKYWQDDIEERIIEENGAKEKQV